MEALHGRFTAMHRTKDRGAASKFLLQQMKQTERFRNAREEEDMVHLKRLTGVKSGKLMQYYSRFVGVEGLKAQLDKHTAYDSFKNPTGTSFLLGRERAFRGFRVLVGSFCVVEDGINDQILQKHLRDNLEDVLGFSVEFVGDESAFARKLLRQHDGFHAAVVISGYEPKTNTKGVKEMSEACLAFHLGGGGLFLLADNDPHFLHCNAVLKAVYVRQTNVLMQGCVRGQNFIYSDPSDAGARSVSNGNFDEHLTMTGVTLTPLPFSFTHWHPL